MYRDISAVATRRNGLMQNTGTSDESGSVITDYKPGCETFWQIS